MVGKKGRRDSSEFSPMVEVGEIDTSAPFQSVKDAVNLFGESAFSAEKPLIRKPNTLNPLSFSLDLLLDLSLSCGEKRRSLVSSDCHNPLHCVLLHPAFPFFSSSGGGGPPPSSRCELFGGAASVPVERRFGHACGLDDRRSLVLCR